MMIARTWHGIVPEEKAEAYHRYLLKTGVIDLKATRGNRGVYIFMRTKEGKAYFQMISLWDSYESIRMFAGEDYELARYYPEDKDYLLELEKYVTHYEVMFASEQLESQGFVH
jgi:heme-degrading monooxygenase HmoA